MGRGAGEYFCFGSWIAARCEILPASGGVCGVEFIAGWCVVLVCWVGQGREESVLGLLGRTGPGGICVGFAGWSALMSISFYFICADARGILGELF